MSRYEIAAFYKFAPLDDVAALRQPLQSLCEALAIKGILLLAPEGINATLAGAPTDLAEALAGIRRLTGLGDFSVKTSFADVEPFLRMKVRLKAEIVTLSEPSADPSTRTGIEVEPEAWNDLIQDPDVLVIDVRNQFEISVGSFIGSTDPQTTAFSAFPAFVRGNLDPKQHRKIAMFCTGGIRCEKASSFMLAEGFDAVYQLKGGILSYLERIAQEESLWRGSCFVFDQRVALGHGLAVDDLSTCFGCRNPLTADDRRAPTFEEGVSCPHCAALLSPAQKASARERHRQVNKATARGDMHLGPKARPPHQFE